MLDKERLDFHEGEDALAVLFAVTGEYQRHGGVLRAEVCDMVVDARIVVALLLYVVHQVMQRKYLDIRQLKLHWDGLGCIDLLLDILIVRRDILQLIGAVGGQLDCGGLQGGSR